MHAPAPPAHRRAAIRAACHAASIPLYAADLATVRGRCLGRRCASRWGVVRVSLDFTADRVDRLATVECAACGRTWRRCAVPALRSAAGYQSVRLSLILPAHARRWFARGRWHREGDDALIVRDASLADLDDAARDHRERADRHDAARQRARERHEAAEREAAARAADLIARLTARDAERREAEAAAAAREVA